MYILPIISAYIIVSALDLVTLARKKGKKELMVYVMLLLISLSISLNLNKLIGLFSIGSLIKIMLFPILKQ